jgi:hypothetical protein
MKFYRETPKGSINSILRQQFTIEELACARCELDKLLFSCNNFAELKDKLRSFLDYKSSTLKSVEDKPKVTMCSSDMFNNPATVIVKDFLFEGMNSRSNERKDSVVAASSDFIV